jgi:uncharacterized cysteine cluster protein YcgN (CxxCxxCC family)
LVSSLAEFCGESCFRSLIGHREDEITVYQVQTTQNSEKKYSKFDLIY